MANAGSANLNFSAPMPLFSDAEDLACVSLSYDMHARARSQELVQRDLVGWKRGLAYRHPDPPGAGNQSFRAPPRTIALSGIGVVVSVAELCRFTNPIAVPACDGGHRPSSLCILKTLSTWELGHSETIGYPRVHDGMGPSKVFRSVDTARPAP